MYQERLYGGVCSHNIKQNAMEEILQTKFKEVIAELGNQFTSHDFIKKFLAMHENDYRQ